MVNAYLFRKRYCEGAARAGCPLRKGPHWPGSCSALHQGDLGMPGAANQVQPRARIIRNDCGDEAGQRTCWEVSPWIRLRVRPGESNRVRDVPVISRKHCGDRAGQSVGSGLDWGPVAKQGGS